MKKRYIFILTVVLATLMVGLFEMVAGRLIGKTLVIESDSILNQVHQYKCLSYADIFCYDHRYGWVRKKDIKFTHGGRDYKIDHSWGSLSFSAPIIHLSDSKMGALEVQDGQSTVSTLSRITGEANSNLGHSGYNLLQYYIWAHDLLMSKAAKPKPNDILVHIDFYSDITLLDPRIWYCYSPFAWQLYPRYNKLLDSGLDLENIDLPISAARITDYYSNRLVVPENMERYIGKSGLTVNANNYLIDRSDLYRLWKRYSTSANSSDYQSCIDNNIRQGGSALHEIFDPVATKPEYWEIAGKILEKFSDLQKSTGVNITFVVHPDPFWHHGYSSTRFPGLPKFDNKLIDNQYSQLFTLLQKYNFNYVDLRDTFKKVRSRHVGTNRFPGPIDQGLFFYKKDTSHMNPYGHALTACSIAVKLRKFRTDSEKKACGDLLNKGQVDEFFSRDEYDRIFIESKAPYLGGKGFLER